MIDEVIVLLIRHCEHSDRRSTPSEHRLREAIQKAAKQELDCFVATLLAMTQYWNQSVIAGLDPAIHPR
ncbi:MAG: hypothetical protein J0I08_20055 [Rhizobiales bacterium]|nr:hypothetical protein [Hyphomicrobiales bacterium]